MSSAVRRWIPALLWTALIFALSSRSTLPVAFPFGFDKLAHFLEYAVLGALIGRGLGLSGASTALAVVLGCVIAALDEVYQSGISGRTSDWADWLADAAGVISGVLAGQRLLRVREDKPRPKRFA